MSDLLNNASLVLIPSGYKEDVVYSAVPTDGSGDMSFTRASNGTRVNSAGLVEVCPWNLATNSENFSSWNLANVTVTTNDITAPNGTLTADKLTISNNANDVKQTISVMPNSVYTWTFYVYGGTALGQQMRFYDNTNSTNIEYYNYSSSVVLGAWVKIERTFTTPSGCYEIQAWVLAATSTIGTMWAWGAQLNIGATAKPYFPTTDRLNVPRLTYQNGGGGCPSLLLEKQSTNIAYPSQAFSGFTKSSDVSLTDNNAISPDGTQNATYYFCNTTTTNGYLLPSWSGTSGVQYAVSFYAKAKELNLIFIKNINDTGGQSTVNLSNGTFTLVSGIDSISVSAVGNGWYRITAISTSSTTQITFIPVIKGSANQGVYIWGLQIEQSTYPTSYIPTTSASATRVADACSKTGISSLIGQTEGTIFVDVQDLAQETFLFSFNESISSSVSILKNSSNEIQCQVWGSVLVTIFSSAVSNIRLKIAFAYKSGSVAVYINGVQAGTSATTFTLGTTMDTIYLPYRGTYYAISQTALYNQLALFKTRLTNAELASLTTL
jgi:hypothetical protein